jgi:hypothetical protein
MSAAVRRGVVATARLLADLCDQIDRDVADIIAEFPNRDFAKKAAGHGRTIASYPR